MVTLLITNSQLEAFQEEYRAGLEEDFDDFIPPEPPMLLLFLAIASLFAFFWAFIRLHFALAKAFGKGVLFTIGLVLFSFIFYLILGFGKARYRDPLEEENEDRGEFQDKDGANGASPPPSDPEPPRNPFAS